MTTNALLDITTGAHTTWVAEAINLGLSPEDAEILWTVAFDVGKALGVAGLVSAMRQFGVGAGIQMVLALAEAEFEANQ